MRQSAQLARWIVNESIDQMAKAKATDAKQNSRGRKSRVRILKEAAEIFISQGYAGSPVSLIAERAGVPIPSIYYHFGSKLELLATIVEERGRWARVDLPVNPTTSIEENIDAIIDYAEKHFEDHLWGLRLRLILSFEHGEEVDDIRKIAQAGRKRSIGEMADRIEPVLKGVNSSARRKLAIALADSYVAGVQSVCLESLTVRRPPIIIRWKLGNLSRQLKELANTDPQSLPDLSISLAEN